MRAAVLRAFDAPLEIGEVPDPRPAGDEVLVRVRAVGVCGTDLKIVGGAFPDLELSLIPGHEVAGEIAGDGGDLAGEVLAAVERGEVRPPIAARLPLEHVNDALGQLAAGGALGKLVIDL